MRIVFVLCLVISGCATAPAQSHFNARGEACHPEGYSFNPIWVDSHGLWCHA